MSTPFAGAGGLAPPPSAGLAPPPTAAEMQTRRDTQPAAVAPPPYHGHSAVEPPPAVGANLAAAPAGAGAGAAFYATGGVANYPTTAVSTPGGQPNDAQLQAFMKDLDGFNSPKCFVRASVSRLPNSVSSKQKTNLPLGIVLQPLAPPSPDVGEVPSVNFGAVGTIIRCKNCRTYINPFVVWEGNGRRWTCNLCGFSQSTLDNYFSPLDETGKRADRYQRPELHKGAVEYIAPGEYMVRPPQPPVFMFVIDVSYSAVATGMLHAVVEGIKQAIQSGSMPGGERLQIGIVTYDTSVHYYNLNSTLSQPQMLVVSDLEDLFLPLPDDILVNAQESESAILNLLNSLPDMFSGTKVNESCMGSAVKGAFLAMKHIGGKMLVFSACIPSVGEFSLKSTREQPRFLGTDREVELLRPAGDSYKELAGELTRAQISVELFVGANAYVDLASIAPLAKFTGGDLRYYPGFHIQRHGSKLRSELLHVLTRYMGWEAVMRVRVSRGWKITKFYGHLFIRGFDLLVVPNCHADQTFAVVVDMEENVTPDPILCVQSALLYTNCEGERRIRVHTWAAVTTQNFPEIVNSVDVQATVSLMANIAMEHSLNSTLAEGRNKLHTQCQQIVQAGNMVSCEALQMLPVYIMGMLKSPAFRGMNEIGLDQRIHIWARLETMSVGQLCSYFYPRLMALHNMPESCGVPDPATGLAPLPDMLNLTSQVMTQDGVYLLDDGEAILIWVGGAVDVSFLQAVFNAPSFEQMEPIDVETELTPSDHPVSRKLSSIVQQVRFERPVPYMQLHIIKSGERNKELRFFSSLIEDKTQAYSQDYQEFLQRMGYRPQQQQQQQAPPSAPPMQRR